MKFKSTSWLNANEDELIDEYIDSYIEFINDLPIWQQRKECLSGLNRVSRINYWSSKDLNIPIKPGDICYFEYGQAFLNEAGYQHFGLVISKFNHKAFVIPMTSNRKTIKKAIESKGCHRNHLYYIGQLDGLDKASVLFLNDSKYINTCRIISVNAHLDPESSMFNEIIKTLKHVIFSGNVLE